MANVHGIKDINNSAYQRKYKPGNQNQGSFGFFSAGQQDSQGNNGGTMQNFGKLGDIAMNNNNEFLNMDNIRFAQQKKVLIISGRRRLKHPKDENYWDMLKQACCPVFTCLSWTVFILIVDIAMFVISLSLQGGFDRSGSLLAVTPTMLIYLGGNQASRVRAGQVYRLIGAFVLHADFLHFIGNAVTTLIFVSRVQYTFGTIKTAIIYILAGIGGNIFSAVCNPGQSIGTIVKVGASTSLYGILGVILGYVIINWYGLNLIGPFMKYQLVCFIMFVVIFIIVFTSAVSNIDYMGHIGGFLAGLWLSAIHQTLRDQKCERAIRVLFLGLFVVQLTVTFVLFYTLQHITPWKQ